MCSSCNVRVPARDALLSFSTRFLLWLPHHDVHSDILLLTFQVYVLYSLEAHFPVDHGIDVI